MKSFQSYKKNLKDQWLKNKQLKQRFEKITIDLIPQPINVQQ